MNRELKFLSVTFIFLLFANVNLFWQTKSVCVSDNFVGGISDAIGPGIGFVKPFEVLSCEMWSNGYIKIATNPNEIVVAPCEFSVTQIVSCDYGRGVLADFWGYEVRVAGFEVISVAAGEVVRAGQIVGSLLNDVLYLKITKGGVVVNIDQIRMMLQ